MDFLTLLLVVLLVVGISTTFWSLVGIGRSLGEVYRRVTSPRGDGPPPGTPDPGAVAILIAAHNEAASIERSLRAAAQLVAPENIHVVSDKSTDATVRIAQELGVNVLDLKVNRGKAGALAEGIRYFELCDRFEVVLILDADTRPTKDYLTTGLPLFADPGVVAVAGRAKSIVGTGRAPLLGRFLVAYRDRLYLIVQLMLKYGQAAKAANVVNIVPGFASMYRTSVLKHIDVAGRGLVIEDFNMTFDVHARKLGRIAFHPSAAVAYTEDPDNLGDYMRQIRRWNLGFWQTVRRYRFRFSKFWVNLWVHIIEIVVSGVLLLTLLPLLALSLIFDALPPEMQRVPMPLDWLANVLPLEAVLVGVLLPDFLLSVLAAAVLKRPVYLLFGLLFPLVRMLDAAICLSQIPRAFIPAGSSGIWTSPKRRDAIGHPPMRAVPALESRSVDAA
ncbi:glycosyltransferase family 2 protein [Arthrobacter agilis]|uniref:glycosyltransferase family 2 protein n=1 Tax=Arthrobacter agilis TaxID=37921 RepID=UPI00277D400E|nr:glycosyltransferase family 2 protein [Arthrobacter agilis]MDQ0734624.1 biofilm PGA synthesis N-glycosyltransferase PgaC [Arthrobacter agilis]